MGWIDVGWIETGWWDPLLIRALALYLPLAMAAVLWRARRPGRRLRGAVYLAALWNLTALLATHLVASRAGWWSFEVEGGLWLGMPVDLLIGWVILWSAVPVLGFDRLPIPVTAAIFAGLDLIYMPLLQPVLVLGPNWLFGEALAIAIGLVPGLAIARWTAEDRRLGWRAAQQAVLFGALLFFLVPAAVVGALGTGSSRVLAEWMASGALAPPLGPGGWIAVALLLVPAALGLLAVREFARVGGGTPFPWDPPKRLVTSGPYAYVANPMQIAGSLSLLIWSIVLASPIVALAAVNATVFAAGLARYSEQADLEARFGEPWRAYRREVGDWWPRGRGWRLRAAGG